MYLKMVISLNTQALITFSCTSWTVQNSS